ncbi:MAG: alpha/beta hydrolase [Candidatus Moranbacteria bacterium]|nr:alpha/beta hydrolase [Candidatus Moranbacteria bacterium]
MKGIHRDFRNKVSEPQSLFGLDYRSISVQGSKETFLLLGGRGLGWEAVTHLAFFLYQLGHSVILVSLPGCGSSRDYKIIKPFPVQSFSIFSQFFGEMVRQHGRMHVISHSMSGRYFADYLAKYESAQRDVKSVIFVNPSGFRKESPMLIFRFLLSKIMHKVQEMHGVDLEELKALSFAPKTSMYSRVDRIGQRLAEIKYCMQGDILDSLKQIAIPRMVILGERDFVFPSATDMSIRTELESAGCFVSVMDFDHNPTILPNAGDLAEEISLYAQNI